MQIGLGNNVSCVYLDTPPDRLSARTEVPSANLGITKGTSVVGKIGTFGVLPFPQFHPTNNLVV